MKTTIRWFQDGEEYYRTFVAWEPLASLWRWLRNDPSVTAISVSRGRLLGIYQRSTESGKLVFYRRKVRL